MTGALQFVSEPVAYQLGWALVHSLWQGAILAIVFALLRSMLRGCSADTRYLVACVMLVILAAAPVITFFKITPSPVTAIRPDWGGSWTAFGLPRNTVEHPSTGIDSAIFLDLAECNRFLNACLPPVVLIWICGVLICSCRWVQGYWWVQRRRSVGIASVDSDCLELLEDLKVRFRIERHVDLVTSALAEVPTVIGWLRPIILLPASSLTGLSPAQLQAILAHELAHVRRCDYLVNTFQNLVETFMFYHPAVWWISQCIRQEREHCCDDMVVKVLQDRLGYARALFKLEQLRGGFPRLGFAASGGSLLTRIRRLVATGNSGPVTVREVGGLTLAGLGILLIAAGSFALLGAQTYCSTVRIKVERRYAVPSPAMNGEQSGFFDPYFIQTEFEVMQSEVILGKVIEDLDLDKQWSRKFGRVLKRSESVQLLKRQMDLRPVRNTSIIEVRVFDENPGRAAEIANKIADTYRDWRREEGGRQSGDHLDSLLAQVKEQDSVIGAAQAKLDDLRTTLKIQDGPDASPSFQPLLSAETLRRVEGLRLESQAEFVRSKVLHERLSSLTPDQLVEAIPTTGLQDPLLTDLVSQKIAAKQRLTALQTEYGPENTEVRKVSNQIVVLDDKIKQRVTGFLAGLSVRVDILAQGLNDLSNEVAKATEADIKYSTEFNDRKTEYARAKRELDEQVEIRKMLLIKIASEKADHPAPKTSVVEIVDPASPSSRPATPNRPRAIALISTGVVLGALGLLLARKSRSSVGVAALV